MFLRCAVCDDMPESAQLAKSVAEKVFSDRNVNCEISLYSNSRQLLFDIDKSNPFDILLLDVEMPAVSGLELAETAKKVYKNCLVIFLTSYLEYAVEGYELDVFRFVPKSEIKPRLEYAVADAIKHIDNKNKKIYIIRKHDLYEKVFYDDILYITKDGKNSVFHIDKREPVSVRKPISVIFEELDSSEFVFIERGCIANITNVTRLHNREWTCKNGEKLTVSRSVYAQVKQKLLNFCSSASPD